jgi:hypothetical protein
MRGSCSCSSAARQAWWKGTAPCWRFSALAGDYHVPWELSDLVRRTYRRALARYGPVDGELLAVALLEEEAGDKLRPRNN